MTIASLFGRYLRRTATLGGRTGSFAHLPLEQLPLVAIDCETTGLNPRRDRIISFAAVRIDEGLRVQETPAVDLLIDPLVTIPERAITVHGIDNAQVAGAPTFAAVFERIADAVAGRVVIGHFVGFDLAILGREAVRARKDWREPPSLDTAALSDALGLRADRTDLEPLLARLGIAARGRRHTAAGDALMAADLFVALAHRLIGQGRHTYRAAVAAQGAPRY